jgi:hypothetical protein
MKTTTIATRPAKSYELGTVRIDVRLYVEGGYSLGYWLGFIPKGEEARQVTAGPMVPGPWPYSGMHAAIITAERTGSARDMQVAREAGLEVRIAEGDVLEIEGSLFRVTFLRKPRPGREGEHLQFTAVEREPFIGAVENMSISAEDTDPAVAVYVNIADDEGEDVTLIMGEPQLREWAAMLTHAADSIKAAREAK